MAPAIAETNTQTISTETEVNQLLKTGNQQFHKSQFQIALQTYQQALQLFQKSNNKIGEARGSKPGFTEFKRFTTAASTNSTDSGIIISTYSRR